MPCDKAGNVSQVAVAADVARVADITVLFLGSDQTTEAANFDRRSLALGRQRFAGGVAPVRARRATQCGGRVDQRRAHIVEPHRRQRHPSAGVQSSIVVLCAVGFVESCV
jgi:hypothetical protein